MNTIEMTNTEMNDTLRERAIDLVAGDLMEDLRDELYEDAQEWILDDLRTGRESNLELDEIIWILACTYAETQLCDLFGKGDA